MRQTTMQPPQRRPKVLSIGRLIGFHVAMSGLMLLLAALLAAMIAANWDRGLSGLPFLIVSFVALGIMNIGQFVAGVWCVSARRRRRPIDGAARLSTIVFIVSAVGVAPIVAWTIWSYCTSSSTEFDIVEPAFALILGLCALPLAFGYQMIRSIRHGPATPQYVAPPPVQGQWPPGPQW